MELKLFENSEGIQESQLHPKFLLLRNQIAYLGGKKIIEQWAVDFIDRDNKFVKEFQTTFHSSFWELFVFTCLKQFGYGIDFSHPYPDFIVSSPYEIYIECVVSQIKQSGHPESLRKVGDVIRGLFPITTQKEFDDIIMEAIARNSNSFLNKYDKYKIQYMHSDWVNNNVPYIIAIGSYDQIQYGREFYYSMISLLYGLIYNPEDNVYQRKTLIEKPGTTSPIKIGLFNDTQFEDVSAVIFSCTTTLGKLVSLSISNNIDIGCNSVFAVRHDSDDDLYKLQVVSADTPEELTDGVFVFHNPYAKNPVPEGFLKGNSIIHIRKYNETFICEGAGMPLVARLHISKSQERDIRAMLMKIMKDYNRHNLDMWYEYAIERILNIYSGNIINIINIKILFFLFNMYITMDIPIE